jgi:hypothetical protein
MAPDAHAVPPGAVRCCCGRPRSAGAYVSGAAGSNACPTGSVRIMTEAACRTAAAAAGKTPGSSSYPFVETYSNTPRGCYYSTSNYAYFNTHTSGAGDSARLLCAATTTGAPLAHRCARVCVPAGAAALRVCSDARVVRRASCAGAYVYGAAGSNECPAGSVRIETEAACRTAAAAAGKTPGSSSLPFVGTDSDAPRGCHYYTSTNEAFFNDDTVGAGYSLQLLCAAVTTGARMSTCTPAFRACVRRRMGLSQARMRDRACVVAVLRCCGATSGQARCADRAKGATTVGRCGAGADSACLQHARCNVQQIDR